jgi:aldehyde:ferredoxin oxidoreductase
MMYYAERLKSLERLYNIREGLIHSMDILPSRLFREKMEIRNHVKSVLDENNLKKAIREYYLSRGWDENGNPTNDTLETLGLEDVKL